MGGFFVACNRINPHAPQRAYRMLEMATARYLPGNGKAVPEISGSKLRGLLEGLNGKTWKKSRAAPCMVRIIWMRMDPKGRDRPKAADDETKETGAAYVVTRGCLPVDSTGRYKTFVI